MFSIPTFLDAFWPLTLAARYTLLVSGLGIALGLVIGAFVCVLALSKSRPARTLAAIWVSYLRGVPMLVQLLVVFFLLPVIGIDVPAIVAAVVTTGIVASAYISEIWRGAILALPNGQTEAAIAIGMRPRDSWIRIRSEERRVGQEGRSRGPRRRRRACSGRSTCADPRR